MLSKDLKHAIHVFEYLVVPEPMDLESRAFQEHRTQCILTGSFRALASIQLDNEHPFQAGEIPNVVFERMLAPKLAAIESLSAQLLPKPALGVG